MHRSRFSLDWSQKMACAGSECVTDDVKNVAKMNNKFTLDLYKQLLLDDTPSSNLFFSPFSISSALAMTFAGARENTAQEIAKALHFNDLGANLHNAFSDILGSLVNSNDSYLLRIANKMFLQENKPILHEFRNITSTLYRAEASNVDFIGNTEGSRKEINEWVDTQTNHKITQVVPRGAIDSRTRLVLVNAIYFKATWYKQFDKEYTRVSDFFVDVSNKIKVNMMYQKGRFHTHSFPDLDSRVIELPYNNEKMCMYIILPNKVDGLQQVESKISESHIFSLSSMESKEKVELFMPRFSLKESYDLKGSLNKLGIVDAFSATEADLSGIDGEKELYVSKILHQAFIEVNEEGTEAAAATAAIVRTARSISIPNYFRVDRPFLFVIKDGMSGCVLFMGKVVQPPAADHAVKDEL